MVCNRKVSNVPVTYRYQVIMCESFSYLVEQWTVCDGNTQGSEAPAQHHVIRSIVAIAATTTGN